MAKTSIKLTALQQEYNKQLRRIKQFVQGIEKRGYFFEGKQKEKIDKLLSKKYISSKHKEKISSKAVESLKNKRPDWFYSRAKYTDYAPDESSRFRDYKRNVVSGIRGRFIERRQATAKAAITRYSRRDLDGLEREVRDYEKFNEYPIKRDNVKSEDKEERTIEPVQIETDVDFNTANLKLVDGQLLVNKATGEVVDVSPDLKIVDGKFIVNTETGEVLGEASQEGQYIYDKKSHQLIGKTTDYSSPKTLPPINEADAIIDNLESLIDNWTPPVNWKQGTYMAKQAHINTLRNILNGAIQRDGKQAVARRISERFAELEQHINTAMYVPYMEKVQEALVAINYIILGRSPDVLESQEFDEEMGEDWEDYE